VPNAALQLQGDRQLRNLLKDLPKKVARKGLKKAAEAGIKPVARSAKAKAPVDTGILRKSIGKKTKSYRNAAVSMTGARTDMTGFVKRALARGDARTAKNATRKVPSNYIHLVQYGTKPHRVGNRIHHGARANPFLKRAFNEQRGAAETAVASTLKEFIESEARKS
jgi:HK97 gp10 family phage protein